MKFKPGDIIALDARHRHRVAPVCMGYVGDVVNKHYTIYWNVTSTQNNYPIVLVDPYYTLQTDILRDEE